MAAHILLSDKLDANASMLLAIQPWICILGTTKGILKYPWHHYLWVAWGSMECSVPECSTHDPHQESKPRPLDLEADALST